MEAPQKKSSSKWLLGLGIGCGGVVVIVIVLAIAGYFFVRNMAQGFRESEGLMKSLSEKFGRVEEYGPSPDGAISPDRLGVFLAVREAAAPARKAMEENFEALIKNEKPADSERPPSKNVFRAVRDGLGVVSPIAVFFKARNQALLDQGMGAGEYYYTYVIVYYSWLKKSPEDGPGIQALGTQYGRRGRNAQDALEMSRDLTRGQIHRTTLAMLRSQLAKWTTGPGSEGTRVRDKWREALTAEVTAMETDRYRIPWQDGLPEIIDLSLRPFRDRLEAGYSRLANLFELAFEQRR
jgi:hypothetical protein